MTTGLRAPSRDSQRRSHRSLLWITLCLPWLSWSCEATVAPIRGVASQAQHQDDGQNPDDASDSETSESDTLDSEVSDSEPNDSGAHTDPDGQSADPEDATDEPGATDEQSDTASQDDATEPGDTAEVTAEDMTSAPVPQGCPAEPTGVELPTDEPRETLIDDFEGAIQYQLPLIDGRDGAWVLGTDGTTTTLVAESSSECALRGRLSGHFAGEGFTDWGANWTAVLRQTLGVGGQAQVYDGSRYSGLSFWAATAPQYGEITLPLGITTIDVAWNGNVCTTCMDYYGTTIEIDSVWRRYVLKFDDLMQSGNGDPLLPMREDQLVGFILWPEPPFELWIDDLRFEP